MVILALCLALMGRWRLGRKHAYLVIFSGLSMLVPLIYAINGADPLRSSWRYALECLPLFMVLAKLGENRYVDRVYLLTALPIQALMLYTFTHGGFVA
jgi:hypothetical protein